MFLEPTILEVSLKVQSSYRDILSKLGTNTSKISCVSLGDSDIDYELGHNTQKSMILDSPYQSGMLKHKLMYNGIGKGLSGYMNCFVRKIDSQGKVYALYDFPPSLNFAYGRIPPSLDNGLDWGQIIFENDKMGYILYFETILDYYFDDNDLPQRLNEKIDIKVYFDDVEFDATNTGMIYNNWMTRKDIANNSILIGKNDIPVSSTSIFPNKIVAIGRDSKIIKTITFNS